MTEKRHHVLKKKEQQGAHTSHNHGQTQALDGKPLHPPRGHMEDHGGKSDLHQHERPNHQSGVGHRHTNFKVILFKSLPLAIPILLLSPIMGFTLPLQFTFQYSDIIVAVLSTFLLVRGGRPFYTGAVSEMKAKKPGMMSLVTLGISVSYLYSLYAVVVRYRFGLHVMDFFFEFASLVLIMLFGHWIEMKAVGEAGDAQKTLAELLPKEAQVVAKDGTFKKHPVSELNIGDVVRVQAGENIPADGAIVKGKSRVNEALLTGEAKPVKKSIGDQVIGGSTNGDSVLMIEVLETGEKSYLSQVKNLLNQAQNQPSRAEGLANKVAGWLFFIALVVATGAFVIWMSIAGLEAAIVYAVATLVVACPHALGLAIPLVIARSTSLGASRGLLVKNREALESAIKADIMVLDKTGTLTTGEFKVLAIETLSDQYSVEEITAFAAGIEAGSSHPIAQSIIQYSEKQEVSPVVFEKIKLIAGIGIEGEASGRRFQLVSEKAYGEKIGYVSPAGATLSILVEGETAIGLVALGDELKEASLQLVKTLKFYGIEPIMATGDNEEAAYVVAEQLEIQYKANQSPKEKYELIDRFKKEGHVVVMVGDGINDAPSLALADVGIAIGAGTQVAMDSADVVLTQSNPGDIEAFLQLAHKTTRKMKENLIWGAGYNLIAIPLAAGIFVPVGLSITPAAGAILMSLSTVVVAINAMLLKISE